MGIREIIKKRFNSSGFTMIEMIAAMVLVSILVPGISVIVRGSLMNVAFTNMAVLANMEANYAQRKFIKDINGVSSFSNGLTDSGPFISPLVKYSHELSLTVASSS